MQQAMRILTIVAAAGGLSLLGTGCESDQDTQTVEYGDSGYTSEHPDSDHPDSEHPDSEHPDSEHPDSEHPDSEHPDHPG